MKNTKLTLLWALTASTSMVMACGGPDPEAEFSDGDPELAVATSTSALFHTSYTRSCGSHLVAAGMSCRGYMCEDFDVLCRPFPEHVGFRPNSHNHYGRFFSEEQGYEQCPVGTVLTGIECSGWWCDDVSLRCRDVDQVIDYGGECFDRLISSPYSGIVHSGTQPWVNSTMAPIGMHCIDGYCVAKAMKTCKLGSSLQISLRTSTGWYVQADIGGGLFMNAGSRQDGAWERFDILDLDSEIDPCTGEIVFEPLMSGAQVRLRAHRGHIVSSLGGQAFAGFDDRPLTEQVLTIQKVDPSSRRVLSGEIRTGDHVALRSYTGYLVAENNGGGVVNMNRSAIGPWETFRVNLRHHDHSRPVTPRPTVSCAPEAPFEGSFSSSFGELRLLQDGDRVYGDYAGNGVIEGTYDEATSTLQGIFTNGTRAGHIEFVLNSPGDGFSGRWSWLGEPLTMNWSGQRTSVRAPDLVNRPAYNPMTGTFDTTYGPLRLVQNGSRVFGDYSNRGIIDATYDRNTGRMTGTFTNGSRTGTIDFAVDFWTGQFNGTWRFSGSTSSGSWSGTRVSSEIPTLLQSAP